MSCASQVFGCAPQLLFLNHEPRNARLCCFDVREMRAAGCDEAQCDHKNRFADVIEIHQKLTLVARQLRNPMGALQLLARVRISSRKMRPIRWRSTVLRSARTNLSTLMSFVRRGHDSARSSILSTESRRSENSQALSIFTNVSR